MAISDVVKKCFVIFSKYGVPHWNHTCSEGKSITVGEPVVVRSNSTI
jgi:hypothetical protein